jgi:general L-amino acid transport system substrate-binding protein
VRKGEPEWADVVRWVLFALINAEEQGHSQADLAESKASLPEVPLLSERLAKNWYENVVSQVGNYAEIFERNLGKNTPLGIDRGANALWTQGGLLYAPPLR